MQRTFIEKLKLTNTTQKNKFINFSFILLGVFESNNRESNYTTTIINIPTQI